jgi:hypothetical protein
MKQAGWVLDVSRLMNTNIGNFICRLPPGPARDEAVYLLVKIQTALMRVSLGLTDGALPKLLGAKPIRGRRGIFEVPGKHVRVYFEYSPGRRLTVLDGGLKTTQRRDIERLGRGHRT